MSGLEYTLDRLYSREEAAELFAALEAELTYLDDPKIFVFGRCVSVPRKMAAYGDEGASYSFSGIRLTARPRTDTLVRIQADVERATGRKYNFVLVNRYADGMQYIGRHRDDERGLDGCIAAVSLGCERKFVFSRKGYASVPLMLFDGSLLVMKEPTNRLWYHSLPKCKADGVRISLTFRTIDKASR